MEGFLKLMKSPEAVELLENEPDCFLLLSLIALRAKRKKGFSALNLEIGEAMIGDYTKCGLTEQRYRTSKSKLEKFGFSTFRSTNKGTVAMLTDKRVYDINCDDEQRTEQRTTNEQATDKQRTTNEQLTTNKKERKKGKKEKKRILLARSFPKPETPIWSRQFFRFPYPEK